MPIMAVVYPACCNSLGKVCCDPSNSLKTGVPLRWLYLPVSTVAREGVEMELVAKQLSNTIPFWARRSMFGVWVKALLYAEMALAAWSSVKMKITLGRSGDGCADACWAFAPAKGSRPAVHSETFCNLFMM